MTVHLVYLILEHGMSRPNKSSLQTNKMIKGKPTNKMIKGKPIKVTVHSCFLFHPFEVYIPLQDYNILTTSIQITICAYASHFNKIKPLQSQDCHPILS